MAYKFQTPKCVCAPGSGLTLHQILAAAGSKNVLCIYDAGVRDAGIITPILTSLRENGFSVSVFEEVVPDPPTEVVEKAGLAARESGADAIIAIGGGSSMDTAKAAALLATNKGPIQNYYNHGVIENPLPFLIAVPTTSGTGSEITPAAVVSDSQLGRKVTLVDPKLVPAYAVLDPNLVLGLPAGVTAATGMDALAHAIEGMTCILHNPMTDGIALAAIRLIVKSLKTCVENGHDLEARTDQMTASALAGMAFGNTAAHVGHAFAHAIGAVYHIPHGAACALALPLAVRNCAVVAHNQLLDIAELFGITGRENDTPEELADAVANYLEEFARAIGITDLYEMKADVSKLEEVVQATLAEVPLINLSGAPVTEEVCRTFYKKQFHL